MASKLGISSIVLAVVVIGTGYYFTSDVGKERITSLYKTYTSWTPENINENPGLYLDACDRSATESLQKLRANEISSVRQVDVLRGKLERTRENVRVATAELGALRALHTGDGMRWPVQWKGRSLDENTFRRQVIFLSKDVKRQSGLAEQYALAHGKMQNSPNAIADAKVELENHRAEIRVQRDLLAIKQIDTNIAEQILNIRATLNDVSLLVSGSSPASLLGVEDIATLEREDGRPDEAEFREAMGW